MGDYGEDVLVKCPFYLERQRDALKIKCEGPVKGTTVQMSFSGSKKWFLKKYCCRDFELCPVNQMLNKKYK